MREDMLSTILDVGSIEFRHITDAPNPPMDGHVRSLCGQADSVGMEKSGRSVCDMFMNARIIYSSFYSLSQ